MRRDEVLRADCYLLAGHCFNVAKPIRIGAETIHHYCLGNLLTVFDDFEDCLTTQASAAADVSQEVRGGVQAANLTASGRGTPAPERNTTRYLSS